MGYELNKLMKQYGVSSPTMASYAGYTDQDRADYDSYVNQYRSRVASTPMYSGAQFQTPLSTPVTPYTNVLTPPVFKAPTTTTGTGGGTGTDGAGTGGGTDTYIDPNVNLNNPLNSNWSNINWKTPYMNPTFDGSFRDSIDMGNVQLRNQGGPVKKFAFGGLNELVNRGNENMPGIQTLSDGPLYRYGPRPKEGPLGPWFEQVAAEVAPGVQVSGGARTAERNREVGGVPNSLHITDNARDFRPPPNMTQGQLLSKLKSELGSDYDVLPSKGRSVHVEPGPSLMSSLSGQSAPAPETELGEMVPPPAADGQPSGRSAELKMLLDEYGNKDSVYAPELAAARKKASDEADAFKTMLESSLESPENAKASKAEMYFRLAAAFGSPTKTGAFGENLALAGKELAEYSKGQRESAQNKLATRLKLQELRMGAAKEELGTLRALSAEEMKDRRAMTQAIMKDYIESGKPQSNAGKQALDEGYQSGTPEFQARVRELAALDVAKETAALNAIVGNLDLARKRDEREERKEKRQGEKDKKLTPQELTLKRETEDSLASLTSAMNLIGKAYALNPNTFDTSLVDQGRRKVLEASGAKDPKLLNTRTLENLLKSQMISSASEKLKGVLSDSDIALLKDIQGLDAKSVEERANVLREAYKVLKQGRTRLEQRLKDVSSGAYRTISGEE